MAKTSNSSTFNLAFKPKLERLLQENKIESIMSSDPQSKASLYYTVSFILFRLISTIWKRSLAMQKNHLVQWCFELSKKNTILTDIKMN